nr:immunoglobulin heavy chain junction region [Mus musculus]NSM08442.1 immunoglobulin heavy chain junction region [Mus musculus]
CARFYYYGSSYVDYW